jgi:hypothetical protein
MEVEECINEKNADFYYNKVANELTVKLVAANSGNNIWHVRYKDGDPNVYIFCGDNFPDVECFTHEILHLYLFKNGFSTFFLDHIQYYNKLSITLLNPKETLDGIANAISHYKMLPLFTNELNMQKEIFFPNHIRYINDQDITRLKNINAYPSQEIFTNFIRHYFNARYYFSDILNAEYNNYFNELSVINNELYSILDGVCNEWEKNINEYDNVNFFTSLYNQLEEYLQ